ncbi:MAG: hypothetical protein ACI4O4_11680 [Candidatus Ventricola sp.]
MYILAALLGITILIAVFFIRRTMQPVVELAKKADDIASVKDGVLTSDSQRETDRIMTVIDSIRTIRAGPSSACHASRMIRRALTRW